MYGEVGVQKASSRTINAGVKERNELIKQCLDNYHDDEASTKKKEADDGMSNMDTEVCVCAVVLWRPVNLIIIILNNHFYHIILFIFIIILCNNNFH